MNDQINYKSNPLNGVGLQNMLTELVSHYGFDILFAYLNINCFKTNPSIPSSVKFLKKTEWAREKVELFYLYKYKNLPKVSSEQFETPPRDRIIPEGQVPGEPVKLNLEDAKLESEQRTKKAAEHNQSGRGDRGGRGGRGGRGDNSHSRRNARPQQKSKPAHKREKESDDSVIVDLSKEDPWAKWK